LFNAYGLSETTSASTLQNINKFNLTAAGYATAGVEVIIFNPDDTGAGEICVRGRNIMNGYLKNEKATLEVIDRRGYFHTGDTGKIDE